METKQEEVKKIDPVYEHCKEYYKQLKQRLLFYQCTICKEKVIWTIGVTIKLGVILFYACCKVHLDNYVIFAYLNMDDDDGLLLDQEFYK